jgi:hypothetical protein
MCLANHPAFAAGAKSAAKRESSEGGDGMARRSTDALAIAMPDFGATIAERAYYLAEQRGFVPGHELEDWLAAEREIAMLKATEPTPIKKPSSRRKSSGATIKKLK